MIERRILDGAGALGIPLTKQQAERFARYHALLAHGNEKMNLTRVPLDDPGEAVDHHYLDSIAPLGVPDAFDGARSLIDVGAGAGFPGIPLSIMRPDIHVVLLDSLQKRVRFLQEVIADLGLNAAAVHMRAEDAARHGEYRERFDLVTARAVAALPALLELTLPFAKVGGRLLAYKGPALDEELAVAKGALQKLGGGHTSLHPIRIPGRDWDHRLLVVEKIRGTPRPYPRKPAEIGKHPL